MSRTSTCYLLVNLRFGRTTRLRLPCWPSRTTYSSRQTLDWVVRSSSWISVPHSIRLTTVFELKEWLRLSVSLVLLQSGSGPTSLIEPNRCRISDRWRRVTSLPIPLLFGVPQDLFWVHLFLISTPVRFRPLLLFMRLDSSSSPTTPRGTSTSILIPIIRLWLSDLSLPVLRISRTGLPSIGWSWTSERACYSILPPRKASTIVLSPLVVGDSVLPLSDQARNMGVTFDSELTKVPHVDGICKCASFHLTLIGRISRAIDSWSLLGSIGFPIPVLGAKGET